MTSGVISKTSGMHLSFFWICLHGKVDLRPKIRVTSNLDHFRGEPGSIYVADQLDDTDLENLTPAVMKALLGNGGEKETFSYQRWGHRRM